MTTNKALTVMVAQRCVQHRTHWMDEEQLIECTIARLVRRASLDHAM